MFKVIPVRHNIFIFEGFGLCGKTFLAHKLKNVVYNDFYEESDSLFYDDVNYVFTTQTQKETERVLAGILKSGYKIWGGKDTTVKMNPCSNGKFLHIYHENSKMEKE